DAENDYVLVDPLTPEPIGSGDPGGDVDGVGEGPNAIRACAVREKGLARCGTDGQEAGRPPHEPRHDGPLDGATPPRAPLEIVALDVQHVGDAPRPAPCHRRLRGHRAPPRD